MRKQIDIKKLWSLEAEAAVLGSMVIDNSCIGDVFSELSERSFYKPEHQVIFCALRDLYEDGCPVDGITLRTRLKEKNQLKQIGGLSYLGDVIDTVPSSASVGYYSKIVKERLKYRELVSAIEEISGILHEPFSVNDQINLIKSIVLEVKTDDLKPEFFVMSEHVDNVANQSEMDVPQIETGLKNIDNIIGGFSGGQTIIIAGRPGMGKSSLALQIALNMADKGLSVIFFTLEMSHNALIKRALRNYTQNELRDMKIVFHENADTPEKQMSFLQSYKQKSGIDAVFIDYLQLMTSDRKTDNRVQEITTISRKIKRMAMIEQVPIVALSQLNRAVESREHHRPRLSDLRDSGSIEQDADTVMLIHREDYYRRNEDPTAAANGDTEVIIAKSRDTALGIAHLVFLDELVRFGDKSEISDYFEWGIIK